MRKISGVLISGLFLTFVGSSSAFADTINDSYIGGVYWDDKNYYEDPAYIDRNTDDALGGGVYNISKIETAQTDSELTVDIYTPFVDYVTSTVQLGDLFLSSNGYAAPADSEMDVYFTGEQWEYALILDDHDQDGIDDFDGSNNVGDLILVSGLTKSDYALAEDVSTGMFRWGQEVLVDFANYTGSAIYDNVGSYQLLSGILSITFDLSLLSLTDDELGMRWTMTCANDIIEGKVDIDPVPEPASMILFGAGLAGFAGLIKRKK